MPQKTADHLRSREDELPLDDTVADHRKQFDRAVLNRRRIATVYDVVAGKVGVNGFLAPSQQNFETAKPPEEVLLRRVDAPEVEPIACYDTDRRLNSHQQKLPEPDLLKSLHAYVSYFYTWSYGPNDKTDFRSFDETALLAMGILLEEASKEALGDNGDMVFTEPHSHDQQMPRSRLSHYQILDKVIPQQVQEYVSSSDSEANSALQERPQKRRRRYRSGGDEDE